MRRRLALTSVVLCSLAAPAAAPAKEISKVAVCGQDKKCVTYDKGDFKNLIFLAEDAGPMDPPAAAAPWFRVRYTVDMREEGGGYDGWTVVYVPSADSIRAGDESAGFEWHALNPRTARVLKRATRHLQAFPGATLRKMDRKLPEVRVDEVYAPAPKEPATATTTGTPWGWIAGAAIGVAVLLLLAARTLRRRRRMEVAPT
jgi:hypothetical protein